MQISKIAKKAMENIWETWALDDTWEEQHRKYVQIAMAKTIQVAIDEANKEREERIDEYARLLKRWLNKGFDDLDGLLTK